MPFFELFKLRNINQSRRTFFDLNGIIVLEDEYDEAKERIRGA